MGALGLGIGRAMKVIHSEASALGASPGTVVAIGNFDGVHRGHQAVFAMAISEAARLGVPSAVLTFEPHPARILAPAYAPPLITSLERKLELIAACGIEIAFVLDFTAELAHSTPERFFDEVLVAGVGARHVCVGHDFTFGKDRAGTVETLRILGNRVGVGTSIVPAVSVEGIVCSSTKVREFALEGRVEGAALLLGRPLELDGHVVHGDGRGRTIGVPTANVLPDKGLLPGPGVYAGWLVDLDEAGTPERPAAINVGSNPTFGPGRQLSVEAHVIDAGAELDLYDRRVRLGFVRRLREERRFASTDALVAQIRSDVAAARQVIGAQAGETRVF